MRFTIQYIPIWFLPILFVGCLSQPSNKDMGESTLVPIATIQPDFIKKESHHPFVVLNFYATHCKPCVKEIPELVSLKQDTSSKIDVLFISLDEPHIDLADFLTTYSMNFTSYRIHNDSAVKFVKRVYPEWNRKLPVSLIYSKKDGLIEKTSITDRDEIEMIVSEYGVSQEQRGK